MRLRIIIIISFVIHLIYGLNIDEYAENVAELTQDSAFIKAFELNLKKLIQLEPNYFNFTPFSLNEYKFDCDVSGDFQEATSVHRLRPQDVRVMAALGDSITAALGSKATTPIGLLTEWRGSSWSIGGDDSLEELVTLPNIMKKFNPNVYGFG